MNDAIPIPRTVQPWHSAIAVIDRLRDLGHESYLVGGCVRDLLLGRPVQDADVATAATPDQVEAAFARTVAVGKSFGVVVAIVEGHHVEVATFRNDQRYIDGRRPTGVTFASAIEDVQRRDFTVNALLLDTATGMVIDHVGGRADLEGRVLRAVGDAASRLAEDRLRVLRGLRFAAQLDLAPEPATWAALTNTSLDGLSRERIVDEWQKGLRGPGRGRWVELLHRSGHLGELGPAEPSSPSALAAALERLTATDPPATRAALWLVAHGSGAGAAWLEAQPLPRQFVEAVTWMLVQAERHVAIPALPLAARRRLLRHPLAAGLARLLACRWPDDTAVAAIVAGQAAEAACAFTPWLRAGDLLAAGLPPGPRIGELLRAAEDAQLAGDLLTRDAALAWVRGRLTR